MRRSFAKRVIGRGSAAAALSLCLLVGVPAVSEALSPPEQGPGEVVFVNAGRIISINADGSDRQVLTRTKISVGSRNFERESLELGDSDPQISPDGQKLAWLRTTFAGGDYRLQLLVGQRNATRRVQLIDSDNSFISSLGWTSGGGLIITYLRTVGRDRKGHERYQQRLLTMKTDGSHRKVLLSGPTGGFLATPWLTAQAISPDGRSLLYTRANMKQSQLRIRDLDSGADRLVTYGVMQASFSPDGNGIVFSPEDCFADGQECDSGKWLEPGLWTVGADGSNLTRIYASRAGVESPSYSPDGSRIIFSSARNTPGFDSASREIYSISSDGSCLTWLTNGSPASHSPAWGPETDMSYTPRGCGADGRGPLVEIRPLKRRKVDATPRLWAGPQIGSRLLSSLVGYWPGSVSEYYTYGDCAYFNPARCSRPLMIESTRRCHALDEIEFGDRHSFMRRRGALVVKSTSRGRPGSTAVASGRAILGIGQPPFDSGRGGRPNTFADHLEAIGLLREVGKPWVPGSKLPARVRKPACKG